MQEEMPIPKYQQTPRSISNTHQEATHLFVLLLGRTLDLCRTSESLLSVLALLAYFSNQYRFHSTNFPSNNKIPRNVCGGRVTYAVVC
jgi:hypothetical protein